MHTEEQARKLWCPIARDKPNVIRCIASKCGAWRWAQGEAVVNEANGTAIQPVMRLLPPTQGYCGLAGKP